jgi:hypothetical protein
MYALYNSLVELNTRLATVPQPVFHYNILLASLAIDSSELTSSPKTQRTPNQLNSEVYDLWTDCREDSAFGIGFLAITRETVTLRPRACTLPSNVYSMACTSQYIFL